MKIRLNFPCLLFLSALCWPLVTVHAETDEEYLARIRGKRKGAAAKEDATALPEPTAEPADTRKPGAGTAEEQDEDYVENLRRRDEKRRQEIIKALSSARTVTVGRRRA